MKPLRPIVRFAAAGRLRVYLLALWKLFQHPETPRAAKWTAVAVLAYAVSPIDLIPDFIPLLGQLDDLILVPLGIALVVRLTPPPLWQALLRDAEAAVLARGERAPRWKWGAALVVAVWVLVLGLAGWWWLARRTTTP